MSKPYNGHKSWAHWNVSLWLFNDENMYRRIKTLLSCNRTKDEVARQEPELGLFGFVCGTIVLGDKT